jgi:hypothetical protein
MSPPAPQAVLKNRRWWRRHRPFAHFVATDVFVPAFYQELEGQFRDVLASGLHETRGSSGFTRSGSGYDAYIYSFPATMDGPLCFFVSRGWHDLLASLVGVDATGDVSAALHHHEPGSHSGIVHNDLNPGWFVARPRPDGINPASSSLCNYNQGTPHEPGTTPVERTRAVAMIFFLNNALWRTGDGGECALYSRDQHSQPAASVPPIDNSVLIFECTPYSYHRFVSNRARSRDSVILWLHRERQPVLERWGEGAIVKWSR